MGDIVPILIVLDVHDKVSLVAHDWGALIGWSFYMTFPKMVDSLVAISVGHPLSYLKLGGFEQRVKGWYTMAFQLEGFAEKLFSENNWAVFHTFTDNIPELDENWIPDLERPGRLTSAINWYRANLNPKYTANPTKIQNVFINVPVLGVYGTLNNYLSKAQMTNSKYFVRKKFSYVEIEGARHWIPIECPEKLMQAIRSFYGTGN